MIPEWAKKRKAEMEQVMSVESAFIRKTVWQEIKKEPKMMPPFNDDPRGKR